jgi:hypothetical protein
VALGGMTTVKVPTPVMLTLPETAAPPEGAVRVKADVRSATPHTVAVVGSDSGERFGAMPVCTFTTCGPKD